jgi:hypothetical protein
MLMNKKYPISVYALIRVVCLLLPAVLALWANSASAAKPAWPEDSAQMQLTREIVDIMQQKHFRKQILDDYHCPIIRFFAKVHAAG